MSDLARKMEAARARVRVDWAEDRAAEAQRGLAPKRARRARRRASVVAIGVVAIALLVVFGRGREPDVARAPRPAPATSAPVVVEIAAMKLDDGSVIRPLAGAIVRPRSSSATRVDVEVVKGGASFDVTPNAARVFHVVAGDVTVDVLGTVFSVERVDELEHGRVRVEVARGRVRVAWANAARELAAGESGTFPPDRPARVDDEPREPAPEARPAKSAEPPPPRPTWRSLAKAGEYDQAYAALQASDGAPPRDVPEELLLAADVARLSGHAAQAVDPLRRVARDHRGDPRAALAAFTLGRVLLDSLGRPREAADAFADVRALGGGGLGEEALAREIEARSRAGDAERARSLAEQYVAKYPDGKRTRSVKKFGGIE